MPPLHIRLTVANPDRDDVVALATTLRDAGHVVVSTTDGPVPDGAAPKPDFVVTEGAAALTPDSLEAAEARHIKAMLAHTGGNRRQAALLLGVARSTLLAKIRKYGL